MTTLAAAPAEWLTREEAALHIGVKATTLAVWASTGRYNLPFYRHGRFVRYRRSDLDEWLESHRVDVESDGV